MTPKLLGERAAADYLGVGLDKLRASGIARRRVYPGQKGLKYYTKDLDDWLDALPKESDKEGENVSQKTDWLAKLDAAHQDQGRQGLHQQG